MELWRGTIATHSIVVAAVSGSDVAWEPLRAPFANGDEWQQYVPIRLPGTLCIQERLPAGAAAVLISRYHSSPDLILPIDAREKQMLDAVDGRRTIAAIAQGTGGDAELLHAKRLFETLFRYDHVVFDSSRS